MRAISLSVLLVLAGTSTALAQDTRSGEVTTYDFMDEIVEGGRYDPTGTRIDGTRRRARETLIRARAHFIPEMIKSVERL
jgi:hypothetical protein